MQNAVTDFLGTSYACLLLVHPEVRRLEQAANELLSLPAWPHLSVGRELSAALLSERPQLRSRTTDLWMRTRLGETAPGPVLCTEIDLLFEPMLELDPLRLIRDISRRTRLVVTWPGSYLDDVLAYAVPDHGHYRTWHRPEVFVNALE